MCEYHICRCIYVYTYRYLYIYIYTYRCMYTHIYILYTYIYKYTYRCKSQLKIQYVVTSQFRWLTLCEYNAHMSGSVEWWSGFSRPVTLVYWLKRYAWQWPWGSLLIWITTQAWLALGCGAEDSYNRRDVAQPGILNSNVTISCVNDTMLYLKSFFNVVLNAPVIRPKRFHNSEKGYR